MKIVKSEKFQPSLKEDLFIMSFTLAQNPMKVAPEWIQESIRAFILLRGVIFFNPRCSSSRGFRHKV
jgi:hypothetical protein